MTEQEVVFLVGQSQVSYGTETKIGRKTNSALKAFKKYDEAKEFMDTIHALLNKEYQLKGFGIVLDCEVNKSADDIDSNILVYHTIKYTGNEDRNKTHSLTYTLYIKELIVVN